MNRGSVYCIRNKTNGKMYIGQSIRLKERIHKHFHGQGGCRKLQNAMKKYGTESFEWFVLHENVPSDILADLEVFCIWQFQTVKDGYNITNGGDGMDSEFARRRSSTPEWKAKNAEGQKKRASRPGYRESLIRTLASVVKTDKWKASHATFIKRRSKETAWKVHISSGVKRLYQSEEFKRRHDEAMRKVYMSDEWKEAIKRGALKRARKVVCVETGKVYDSLGLAAEDTGCTKSAIQQCCKGTYKTSLGLHWKYAE